MAETFKSTINYEPLSRAVIPTEIDTYLRTHKRPSSGWVVLIVIASFMWAIFFIGFLWSIVPELFSGSVSSYDLDDASAPLFASLAFAALALIGVALNFFAGRAAVPAEIRLQHFAEMNGLKYQPGLVNDLSFDGLIFNVGQERRGYNTIRSRSELPFTIGTQIYTTGSGRGRSTNSWAFAAVTLDEAFTHTILDAKSNNGKFMGKELFSSLPKAFDNTQKVTVSPEIDAAYNSYSASEDTGDIKRLLSSDALARIATLNSGYDIELKGNQLYFYSETSKTISHTIVELLELIDVATAALKASPRSPYSPSPSSQSAAAESSPQLRGGLPVYIKVLGIAAVIIQLVALILFIAL